MAAAAETERDERTGQPSPSARSRLLPSGPGQWIAWAGALLVAALLTAMAVRLPWAGDLGIHAATLQRLRHSLGNPGDPLVDADVASPYYSPWMVLLALVSKVTGLGVFGVLHLAAFVDLVLLLTGIRAFVRTLTDRRAAVPLAVLCVALLGGWELFTWSGFPGLTSLSLCLAYPSTFALGMAFHLWALVRRAVAGDWGLVRYLGLGVLLAVVLLSHQFTGVFTVLGLLAILLAARPWPSRAGWLRAAAGVALAAAILAVWPYYSFFSLLGVGGLDAIHRPLYHRLAGHFAFVLLGVAALVVRARRDRRDPLVIFFLLGALVYTAGGLTGHYAYGRVLPAMLLSAQIALAVEATRAGTEEGAGAVRTARVFAWLGAAALVGGLWANVGTLGYLTPVRSVPVLRDSPRQHAWASYAWIGRRIPYGQTIMTKDYFPLRQAPAYGAYTVESGYPDFFLPDDAQRAKDTERYFAPGTSRAERLHLLHKYHVRWVVEFRNDGGLGPDDPALRFTAKGPGGERLYHVVA